MNEEVRSSIPFLGGTRGPQRRCVEFFIVDIQVIALEILTLDMQILTMTMFSKIIRIPLSSSNFSYGYVNDVN